MEDSDLGTAELLDWIGKLVGDSDELRNCQPHYDNITLNELGEIAAPSGRSMLHAYGDEPVSLIGVGRLAASA